MLYRHYESKKFKTVRLVIDAETMTEKALLESTQTFILCGADSGAQWVSVPLKVNETHSDKRRKARK